MAFTASTIFFLLLMGMQAAPPTECSGQFCISLKRVIAARDTDFRDLRGKTRGSATRWTAKVVLPQAYACQVGGPDPKERAFYMCHWLPGAEEARPRFDGLIKDVGQTLGHDWKAQKEGDYGEQGEETVVFTSTTSKERFIELKMVSEEGAPTIFLTVWGR